MELRWVARLQSGESITAERILPEGEYPVFGGGGLRGYTDAFTHDGEFPLIGRQGALCGNINIGCGRFWASEHSVVVSPTDGVNTRWLAETLRTMNLNQYSVSAAQPGLSVDVIRRLSVPVPPIEEQQAIASFLDRETAKIDALVDEQERLIALLKEKRQAVISHAVTNGLNPDALMKYSGVDWLGAVPAAWTVTPLRYLVHSVGQGWSPQCESYAADLDSEYGVLKVGAVNGGVFDPSANKKLPPELEPPADLAIRRGDLMISRANTRELVGSAAVAVVDYPRLLLCDKLYRLRFRGSTMLSKFISLYLASPLIREQIELGASGASASMLNISQSVILDLPTPVPPVEEMRTILEFCERSAQETSELIVQAEQGVSLLLERRAALITAAVTGQIDVSGLASAEAA
jgi:type I restriction enzyme S subunit